MEPKKNRMVDLGFVLLVCGILGCSGQPSQVRGTVRLDGNPLPNANLVFFPNSGGTVAYGQSNAQGEYRLMTGQESGLAPGEYSVCVVATEATTSMFGKNGGPPDPGKLITPEKYKSKDTSGLRFTVNKGNNEIDIELSSK